jgi:excinuclease ABC subunit B
MAKPPDSKKPKDPARPTRAKAAREPLAPIAPHLEKLLNPGIAKGTAGVGSQTGLTPEKPAKARSGTLPGKNATTEEPKTGLQPPPDNSWDRRQDFSASHRARKSVASPLLGPEVAGREPGGFAEAQQAKYTSDEELVEASPELARALGLDGDTVSFPEPEF